MGTLAELAGYRIQFVLSKTDRRTPSDFTPIRMVLEFSTIATLTDCHNCRTRDSLESNDRNRFDRRI